MEPPVRRRLIALLVLAGIGGLVLAGVWFRLPGLEPGIAYVTQSPFASESLEIEYRMRSRFQLQLDHLLDDRSGVNVHESPPHLRKAEAASFPSSYDPLRGQHYVKLRLARKDGELLAEGNGRLVAVPIWCEEPIAQITFGRTAVDHFARAVRYKIIEINGQTQHESIQVSAVSDEVPP